MLKTKLRIKLEALAKGKSLRVSGVTASRTPAYLRANSTIGNIRASTGRKFSVSLGSRALTITRTK